MKTQHLKTTRTARYQVLASEDTNQPIRECWIVLHGYAQLAAEFLKPFETFQNPERLIVAPEGLNRFYAKGFNGRPAATWMTSEDREYEIEDYCNYLQQLYILLKKEYELPADCKFVLLGFSQGVATLCRWIQNSKPEYDTLIFYAGSIANDLDWKKFTKQVNRKKLYIISGDKDPFISLEKLNEVLDDYKTKGLQFERIFFEGGHEIKTEALAFLEE